MQQSEGGTAGAGNKCSSPKKLEALILMRAETEKRQRWGQKRDRKESTEGEEQEAQKGKSRGPDKGSRQIQFDSCKNSIFLSSCCGLVSCCCRGATERDSLCVCV